jgi:hypothetical protein
MKKEWSLKYNHELSRFEIQVTFFTNVEYEYSLNG